MPAPNQQRPILRVPGSQPRESLPESTPASSADDLAEFADGAPLPAVDPVQVQLAELTAEVSRLKRRGQADPAKPNIREPEMSEAEALAEMNRQAASGVRPRAILTPSGWMTHREMARGPGSLGNAIAGAAVGG